MMDSFYCPAYILFLCMVCACFILSCSFDTNIGNSTMTPFMMSRSAMSDISPVLVFTFWQPVYILLYEKEQSFPGKSKDVHGHFVGISENIGHAMTAIQVLFC